MRSEELFIYIRKNERKGTIPKPLKTKADLNTAKLIYNRLLLNPTAELVQTDIVQLFVKFGCKVISNKTNNGYILINPR